MKVTPEQQLGFLGRDVTPLVKAVVEGFHPDPGTSDLDDEQPIHICIPLGEYRRAVRLLRELALPHIFHRVELLEMALQQAIDILKEHNLDSAVPKQWQKLLSGK